ncbi:hypothetical protein KP509_03G038600 [Ceratopteris richardii]|nr:hypothetical protein KP509_03G038600 [Ceratopteris richardii]
MAFLSSMFTSDDSCKGRQSLSQLLMDALGTPNSESISSFIGSPNRNNVSTRDIIPDFTHTDGKKNGIELDLKLPSSGDDNSLSNETAGHKVVIPSWLPASMDFVFSPGANSASFLEQSTMTCISDLTDMPNYTNPNEKTKGNESDDNYPTSINSAAYKAMMPTRLPISNSFPAMHFKASSGISPASLLESPILFSMQQADPSPTTGSLSIQKGGTDVRLQIKTTKGSFTKDMANSELELTYSGSFDPPYMIPLEHEWSNCSIGMDINAATCSEEIADINGRTQRSDALRSSMSASDLQSDVSSDMAEIQGSSAFQASNLPSKTQISFTRLNLDEYNWKKYGQKQLKDSENPRSYYKCTHPHCPAKRQVECTQEGALTQIIYKGDHNHEKPLCTRRGFRGSKSTADDMGTQCDRVAHTSNTVCKINHDKVLIDSYEFPHNPISASNDLLSMAHDDDDQGGTRIANDIDSTRDSKRRRTEDEQLKPSGSNREPRFVVQTESDLDVLDDGYRWQKYGQKVLKDGCYPRNYYRCSNRGCTVKKQVERCASDIKFVITTYEGKHNHGVPAARSALQKTNSCGL